MWPTCALGSHDRLIRKVVVSCLLPAPTSTCFIPLQLTNASPPNTIQTWNAEGCAPTCVVVIYPTFGHLLSAVVKSLGGMVQLVCRAKSTRTQIIVGNCASATNWRFFSTSGAICYIHSASTRGSTAVKTHHKPATPNVVCTRNAVKTHLTVLSRAPFERHRGAEFGYLVPNFTSVIFTRRLFLHILPGRITPRRIGRRHRCIIQVRVMYRGVKLRVDFLVGVQNDVFASFLGQDFRGR